MYRVKTRAAFLGEWTENKPFLGSNTSLPKLAKASKAARLSQQSSLAGQREQQEGRRRICRTRFSACLYHLLPLLQLNKLTGSHMHLPPPSSFAVLRRSTNGS
jgi:hypothetical protein